MINIKRTINDKIFVIQCDKCLKNQAEALFDIIAGIDSHKLIDEFMIQVGWNIFTVVEKEGEFCITAPDYRKNPFTESTVDLTLALWIQLEQGILLNELNLIGEMISFQDKIVCAKGVLSLDNIYLERSAEYENGDSGWYLGPVDDSITTEEYESLYAYQLLNIRPAILKTLALPNGYMVVFDQDKIEAILNENDIDILK